MSSFFLVVTKCIVWVEIQSYVVESKPSREGGLGNLKALFVLQVQAQHSLCVALTCA